MCKNQYLIFGRPLQWSVVYRYEIVSLNRSSKVLFLKIFQGYYWLSESKKNLHDTFFLLSTNSDVSVAYFFSMSSVFVWRLGSQPNSMSRPCDFIALAIFVCCGLLQESYAEQDYYYNDDDDSYYYDYNYEDDNLEKNVTTLVPSLKVSGTVGKKWNCPMIFLQGHKDYCFVGTFYWRNRECNPTNCHRTDKEGR